MTIVTTYDPSLFQYISSNIVTSHFSVACFAMVVYDWILTFGQEIELIWRQRWSLMTVLYLSVRYVGLPYLLIMVLSIVPSVSLTDTDCTDFTFIINWINIVVTSMTCAITVARLYAMYQQSRKILIILVAIVLLVTISNIVICIMGDSIFSKEELIISGTWHVCIVSDSNMPSPFIFSITWILSTVWEVIALCLALWIAVKHFRELQRPSIGWAVGDCFRVLVRTHVFYFAAYLAASCLYLIFLTTNLFETLSNTVYYGFLQVISAVQMFVLGPRLILGVREYHAKLVADSDEGDDMNSIAFQARIHISTGSGV